MLTQKDVKRNGKVDLWDLGPAKDDPAREKWEQEVGAHKREMWAADARHALTADKARYVLKLPKGVQPGSAQAEADERAEYELEEAGRLSAADPQYGTKGR
jgi:hypothetical protein